MFRAMRKAILMPESSSSTGLASGSILISTYDRYWITTVPRWIIEVA
jgi:hypothetical protein